MQTFLPYSNFQKTAEVLDWRRLGKQRVEAMQIHNTIINNTGWKHHPIVKMWTPYLNALKLYHNIINNNLRNIPGLIKNVGKYNNKCK